MVNKTAIFVVDDGAAAYLDGWSREYEDRVTNIRVHHLELIETAGDSIEYELGERIDVLVTKKPPPEPNEDGRVREHYPEFRITIPTLNSPTPLLDMTILNNGLVTVNVLSCRGAKLAVGLDYVID